MTEDLRDFLSFINISTEEYSLFEWKPPRSFKSYVLDLKIVKEYSIENIFFHLNKGTMRIAYIKKGKIILSVGSDDNVQFQLLEALLEAVDKRFNETYDISVILSYGNVSESIFAGFKAQIEEILDTYKTLNLGKEIRAFCRVCNKALKVFIKQSMIDNADSYPVPIVYNHEGHAILCYIDKNYEVRGVELVNITG